MAASSARAAGLRWVSGAAAAGRQRCCLRWTRVVAGVSGGVVRVAGSDGSAGGARWRVFISHTSELRDFPEATSYVAAVERAVSAAGHVIVDMADFAAADQPPAQVCAETGARVRRVRGGAGHPVRLAGAGQAGGVVYGAGVRHRDRGGPGPAGVPAGHRRRGCGYPAVGADRSRVRGPAGRVPPPGAGQRADSRSRLRARPSLGSWWNARCGTWPRRGADRQRDPAGAGPGRAAAGAGVEVRQPAAGDGAGLVSGPAGGDRPAGPVCD